MKQPLGILLCSAALALSTCGKDEASTAAPDKPQKVTVTKTTPTITSKKVPDKKKAVKEPEKSPDNMAAKQCQTVLANAWKTLQPSFQLVGQDPSGIEKNYLADSGFLKKCETLAKEKLACLSTSENPFIGMTECKINEGIKRNESLRMPRVSERSPAPVTLPEEEQAKRLASVVGTWKNEWKAAKTTSTWKINESGEVVQTRVRDEKTDEKAFTIVFDRADAVKVNHTPTSAQWYGYLRVNKKTMYLASNRAYGAHPIENDKKFILAVSSGRIIYDKDVCKVFSNRGEMYDGTCTWGKSGKNRTFEVEYQESGRDHPSKSSFHYIAGHLVDYRQVKSGLYKKK